MEKLIHIQGGTKVTESLKKLATLLFLKIFFFISEHLELPFNINLNNYSSEK